MNLNKINNQSNLLHIECYKLFKTPQKQLIINEVLYKLSKIEKKNINENDNKNDSKKVKNIYEKLLIIIGCF